MSLDSFVYLDQPVQRSSHVQLEDTLHSLEPQALTIAQFVQLVFIALQEHQSQLNVQTDTTATVVWATQSLAQLVHMVQDRGLIPSTVVLSVLQVSIATVLVKYHQLVHVILDSTAWKVLTPPSHLVLLPEVYALVEVTVFRVLKVLRHVHWEPSITLLAENPRKIVFHVLQVITVQAQTTHLQLDHVLLVTIVMEMPLSQLSIPLLRDTIHLRALQHQFHAHKELIILTLLKATVPCVKLVSIVLISLSNREQHVQQDHTVRMAQLFQHLAQWELTLIKRM